MQNLIHYPAVNMHMQVIENLLLAIFFYLALTQHYFMILLLCMLSFSWPYLPPPSSVSLSISPPKQMGPALWACRSVWVSIVVRELDLCPKGAGLIPGGLMGGGCDWWNSPMSSPTTRAPNPHLLPVRHSNGRPLLLGVVKGIGIP